MPSIMWFRETDIRMHDNTALSASCDQSQSVIGIFFITPETWAVHNIAPCRIQLMLRGLQLLEKNLASRNIPLFIYKILSYKEIPNIILDLANTFHVQHVFANKQYEINELQRDQLVCSLLSSHEKKLHCLDDQSILKPNQLKTGKGEYYTVFTPYKKAWVKHVLDNPIISLPVPEKKQTFETNNYQHPNLIKEISSTEIEQFNSAVDPDLWPAGEKHALKMLDTFLDENINKYKSTRDYPILDKTSKLSAYLATGMLSARVCFLQAKSANDNKIIDGNTEVDCWISELIWRDFYKQILISFPRVCKDRAFKQETDKLVWHNNNEHFEAWKNGQTGFPLVDAAMRQLKKTGWMHNRLRMLTAMFLSKFLWLDWRKGEAYFMQHLIDGDFASNNGGWQWSASTGTDAAPYFRIFNPTTQSERFDSDGAFIKKYCPELASLDKKTIHNPYVYAPEKAKKLDYPKPIIDYKSTRAYAIEQFKAL